MRGKVRKQKKREAKVGGVDGERNENIKKREIEEEKDSEGGTD